MIDRDIIRAHDRASEAMDVMLSSDLSVEQLKAFTILVKTLTLFAQRIADSAETGAPPVVEPPRGTVH